MNLWQDLRRRRIYRLIGLYIVGAWLAIQVASTFFPAWGIPDTALRYLIIAAALGFPIALVFGWFFDITADGIVRTHSARESESVDLTLRRPDYLILTALAIVAVAILVGSFEKVREATDEQLIDAGIIDKPSNSIAILPFVNMNDDTDTEYFSDGVTEEILHHLSALKTLRVIGRTSSFAFKNSSIAVPKLSDILQVKYLLQGSVRKDRDQVRVTASLVDDSGYQVWSETFDRKLDSIFAIQTEIAGTVAGQLLKEIGTAPDASLRKSDNIDAYQEYLLGRDYVNRRPPSWQQSAMAAFRKSIELDSQYALPYADLAVAIAISGAFGTSSESIEEAQGHIDRALALQPDLAEAHAAQGLILTMGPNQNFPAAELALRKALNLDPGLVIAYNWLSTAISSQGRLKEGDAVLLQALDIDPLNAVASVNLAAKIASSGDFHRAERILLRLMDLPEPPSIAYWGLESLYFDHGRLVDALDWIKRVIRVYGREQRQTSYGALGNLYEHLGMPDDANYWHEKSAATMSSKLTIFLRKAYIMKLRGEYGPMEELLDSDFGSLNIDYRKLPKFAAEIIAAINITVGRYEYGIEAMEFTIDVDAPLSLASGGGGNALDFMQLLAYAYRQLGNEEAAIKLLNRVQQFYELRYEAGYARGPVTLETMALNHAMQGDTDRALELLDSAATLGWRRYHFIIHDLRWAETLASPEFRSLMNWVKADIDRQRERVKAIDAKDGFRAYVEQLEASEQS